MIKEKIDQASHLASRLRELAGEISERFQPVLVEENILSVATPFQRSLPESSSPSVCAMSIELDLLMFTQQQAIDQLESIISRNQL